MNEYLGNLIFLFLSLPFLSFSQDNHQSDELAYEVNRLYSYITISKDELKEAKTLVDLNKRYKSSWVKEYISVEIFVSHKGNIQKAVSKNDTLSQEQKDLMYEVDSGKDIKVVIHYIPENNLKDNPPREMSFSLTIDPPFEAQFPGGSMELKQYLQHAINNISSTSFNGYDIAAIKFSIDQKGEIVDPHVFWSSKDKKVDELLLETICNMPNWEPAKYADGVSVKQEFAFTIGNMENCVMGMLNIQKQ